MDPDALLEPKELKRYADAIVKGGLSLRPGDTLVVRCEHAHRDLMVAVTEAAYRAGAEAVEPLVADPRMTRARLKYARDDALGAITPWAARRLREMTTPTVAQLAIAGVADPDYLDGIPAARIRTDLVRASKHGRAYQRAALEMRARWTIAGWPTDHWAGLVYPELLDTRRQAPPRARPALVLPAYRRRRTRRDRVAEARARDRTALREAVQARP